jgi:hypothetical protein
MKRISSNLFAPLGKKEIERKGEGKGGHEERQD